MNREDSFDFDLVVIGGGSAGVRAARMAASYGARVALCESDRLGGTCVNVGCVPKKLMVYGSHFAAECREARGYGWDVAEPTHDWATFMANKDREIARLNGVYQRLLEGRGVRILRGRGVLRGPHTVEIQGSGDPTTVTSKYILVATGGRPTSPTMPGAEHIAISDDMFRLKTRPRRVLVAGGGYIAVEFAGIFAGFGSRVALVHRGPLFLRGFDRDVRLHLESEMRQHGIELHFKREIAKVERNGALRVSLSDGTELEVDLVLAALGRHPNTAGLGLEEVGVAVDSHNAVKVDERFRTSVPSIYAVGDVIDRIQLTPVALAEGMIVARNLFAEGAGKADYEFVPSAVFSSPPIGSVGFTEEEARAEFGEVDVYRSTFTPMKLTLTEEKAKTLMKLVVARKTQRVVGVHMVGPDAGEIVQGFAVALKCGATKAQFDATIGIHPTAAEELVTMRERLPDPDHEMSVSHEDAPRRRRIVHHRWEQGGG
ncbi:MAG: glutathione-disulfide reductase [Polyangiaceae bacterium]